MRYWLAIALGLGVIALIALVFPLVQGQRHLREVRAELGRTNEQLARTTGTISNLKAELDSPKLKSRSLTYRRNCQRLQRS
jgi:predicted transcriptional regulator